MKKELTSRSWRCLDLQPCLSQLPKVSVRKWNLRVYGSLSLIISLYYSPPKAILPLWIAQGCDLANSGARTEFLVGHCCLEWSSREVAPSHPGHGSSCCSPGGCLGVTERGKKKQKTLDRKSLHREACSSKKQSHEDLTEYLNCFFYCSEIICLSCWRLNIVIRGIKWLRLRVGQDWPHSKKEEHFMGLISTGYPLVPLTSPFSLCRSSAQGLNLYLTSSKLGTGDSCQGPACLKGVGVLL